MLQRVVVGLALAALVFGSAVVGSASAQQQGRGRGGPGGRGGGGTSLTGLLRNEAVQKELGLDEAAISKTREIGEKHQSELQAELEKAGVSFTGLRDLPEAERNAKMAEMREKSTAISVKLAPALREKLKDALSADQLTRLMQIQLQAAGAQGLAEAEVQTALKLSDEQKSQIAAAIKENGDKQRALFGAGGGEDARGKFAELRTELETKVNDILTADQKAKLAELKGKPFDVAQLRDGGRGRRGGNRNDNN